jgi:nucleoid-associated protein YgaU
MNNSPNALMGLTDPHTGQAIPSAGTVRRLLPLLAWMAALGVAIGLLLLMGKQGLSTPSILEPSAWPTWAAERDDPLEVAFALLRLVGLAAAWYLLGVTTIGVVARLLRWGRLVNAADVLTVPWVRHLLQAALGLGLATAAVTGTTMGQTVPVAAAGTVVAVQEPVSQESASLGTIIPVAATRPDATEVLRVVPPATSPQAPAAPSVQAPAAPSVQAPAARPVQAPPAVSAQASQPASTPKPSPPPAPSVQERAAPSAQASQPASAPEVVKKLKASVQDQRGTYVVRHGDHLWGIAEKALEQAWGHSPADEQIAPYWQQLIEANRAEFVDPGNPDLILPGQALVLPPPPPAPG